MAVAVGAAALLAAGAAAQDVTDPARVVILGVGHSTQLVSEAQQPAALWAFFDRVAPDVIAVERSPEEFARGDHYEFTYEIQHVALPYARERGVPVYPVDWIPSKDDMLLGFGLDLESPPFIRSGWQGFLAFPDSADLRTPLLFADSDEDRALRRAPWQQEWEPASRDLPRRLFLYRTFLQAQRIAAVAERYPGRTVLVPIGANHKDDIERILQGHRAVEIVQPSSFGAPSPEEVERAIRMDDLAAIASFNLLGAQAGTGNVDWDWLTRVVARLSHEVPSPESRLFQTRLAVLAGARSPAEALEDYRQIADDPNAMVPFTWNGVKDASRVDSYFDPFGNLSVAQRAALESARELYKLGDIDAAAGVRNALSGALTATRAAQFLAYWPDHVYGLP